MEKGKPLKIKQKKKKKIKKYSSLVQPYQIRAVATNRSMALLCVVEVGDARSMLLLPPL
jgi:hypothetical protein